MPHKPLEHPGKVVVIVIAHRQGGLGHRHTGFNEGDGPVTPQAVDVLGNGAAGVPLEKLADVAGGDAGFGSQVF